MPFQMIYGSSTQLASSVTATVQVSRLKYHQIASDREPALEPPEAVRGHTGSIDTSSQIVHSGRSFQ